MAYDPAKHHRRSTRLRGYDYTAPGAYFVTICVQNRECLFGDVVDGEMRLNGFGEMVRSEWLRTAVIRHEIELDAYVVMPNHIHGIIRINGHDDGIPKTGSNLIHPGDVVGADGNPPLQRTSRSLGSIIAGFKSVTTKRINAERANPCQSIWQRNYHDHIIRDATKLERIRQYITNNPTRWERDGNRPTSAP